MKVSLSLLRVPVLILLMAMCGAFGGIASLLFGQRYQVRAALPLSPDAGAAYSAYKDAYTVYKHAEHKDTEHKDAEPSREFVYRRHPAIAYSVYKDAEPSLNSSTQFEQFAKSRDIDQTPEAQQIEKQLARKASGPVRFDYELSVSRTSLRNVPDAFQKDAATEADSSIVVSAKASSAERALGLENVGIAFVRAILVKRQMERQVREWQLSDDRLADFDHQLLTKQAELTSLDRQVDEMRKLRGEDKTISDNSTLVQVQVNGRAYLPVPQQIIALQSRKISAKEELRSIEDEVTRLRHLKSVAVELASIMRAESDPVRALGLALKRVHALRAEAPSIPEKAADDLALSGLTFIKKTYVDSSTNPARALPYRTGFGLVSGAAIGIAVGIFIWALFLYLSLLWMSKRSLLDEYLAKLLAKEQVEANGAESGTAERGCAPRQQTAREPAIQ